LGATALKSGSTEASHRPRTPSFLRALAGPLALWREGLAVLRDWKIHADFFSPSYQQNNLARLQHLESLGLDFARKNVLEVGAGTGDHSLFYLYRNCRLLAVEGRPRLATKLSRRLGIRVEVVDVDRSPEKLERLGRFDLIHCYGLLYHLSDPGRFLTSASRVADCLLLETCVSFGREPRLNNCWEPKSVLSQAIHGQGCRPSREWVFQELKLRFEHVYATRTQPRHPEFPTDWTEADPQAAKLMRAVFVASHTPISNPNLLAELPCKQARW